MRASATLPLSSTVYTSTTYMHHAQLLASYIVNSVLLVTAIVNKT